MEQWKCGVCGYIHKGNDPPQKCPVCGADRNKFTLVGNPLKVNGASENSHNPQAPPEPEPSTTDPHSVKRWKCSVCGYIHTGPEPPEKCPVCGADRSKFILIDDDTVQNTQPSIDTAEESISSDTDPVNLSGESRIDTKENLLQTLTKLHAHPIAVHIPNGVLPLTVLFTIIAVLFNSEGFAKAATYNIIFVCLAMPGVILTGLIDWRNRFERRMSQVFAVKMVCAGIVLLLSTIVAIWWVVQPDVYLGGTAKSGFFIALNICDLAAAAVAGWYGGKLVFSNN